jgi:hypothetical protein
MIGTWAFYVGIEHKGYILLIMCFTTQDERRMKSCKD